MYELGIQCGHLLTMQAGETTVLQQQFLAIDKSKVVEIKPWEITDRDKVVKFIDASNQLVMPGLINGHAHLPMNLLRGLAEDLPFWQWLQQIILPVEKRFVNPEFVRTGTELALLELIRAGITTVAEMYYFEDIIADTIERVGLRAVLGETITDFSCPDDPDHHGNCYRIVETMVERYRHHARITPCIAPHSPYGCSNETLIKTKALAEKHNLTIKTHVAETQEEVQQSLAQYKLTPVERLYQLGLMDKPAIFAHGIHLNESDIELIASTGTRVIYNPKSNMKLSCGIAPIRKLMQLGVTIGIGTDSATSNNSLNIINELATGMKLQKLYDAEVGITSKDMLRMATINGAKALGLGEQTGSLEVGKKADCIILDLDAPHLQPLYDIPTALVYAAQGAEIVTTICHGQVLMENRVVNTIDTERLYAEVKRLSEKIRKYLP